MSNAHSFQPLRWIKDELDSVIHEARRALEDFAEGDGGDAAIGLCAERLHQLHGIFHMAQLDGPAMLSEEMEQVAVAMKEGGLEHPEESAETLMVGLAQLPEYLDKLQEGVADTPLLVLTELNDLRAVRNAPLLTEAAFFSPDESGVSLPEKVGGTPNPLMRALAQKVRGHFHKGLLDWYRGNDPQAGIKRLRDVFKLVSENAHTVPVFGLFHVARAVMEGLFAGEIETGSALKSVVGKLDQALKVLVEAGESDVDEDFAREVRVNLLYYLAKAHSGNQLIQSVQREYRLQEALPDEEELIQNRTLLHSPGQALYASVGHVLEAEMEGIKDDLDLFIRSDRSEAARLGDLIDPLHKLADTLGVLGQGSLRARLLAQIELIEEIVNGSALPGDTELTRIASELLYVESSMSDLGAKPVPQAANDVFTLPQGEFLQLVEKTMYEAAQEMGGVKSAVEAYAEGGAASADELGAACKQLHRIAGALRMLDHAEAASLAEQAESFVEQQLAGAKRPVDESELDAFAELITGIELYMEELPGPHPDLEKPLSVARAGLAGLNFEEAVNEDVASVTETEPHLAEVIVLPEKSASSESVLSGESDEATESGQNGGLLDDIDSEILEIFVEEAREELNSLNENYPRWKNEPNDSEALVNVRRSFHTLKGSGRLVGASTIGEFAWSIEHLLNKVLENEVRITPGLLQVVDEALATLPELIDCQESGSRPVADFLAVQQNADLLAEGGEIEVAATARATEEPAAEPGEVEAIELAEAPISVDPELFDIFQRETRAHIDQLRAFIAECRQSAMGCRFKSDQVREFHTLKGSARVAGVQPIADIGKALERLASSLSGKNTSAGDETFTLIEEALDSVGVVLSAVNQPGAELPDTDGLIGRIDALEQSVVQPVEIVEAPIPGEASVPKHEEVIEPVSDTADVITLEPEEADSELIAIFTEEANELFDDLESGLQKWRDGGLNESLLDGLRRTLHTLKGGARLAGLMPTGDLSHTLESLFTSLTDRRMEGSDGALSLAEKAADELASQIERVKKGEASTPALHLIEQIEGFISGEPVEHEPVVAEPETIEEQPALVEEQAAADEIAADKAVETPPITVRAFESKPEPTPAAPRQLTEERQEQVKVSSGLLDRLVNDAGEISIQRARLEQHNSELGFNLDELEQTVARLHSQLRKLDIETEAQILHRFEREHEHSDSMAEFDPLEFDRFSTMQQLSRSLMETVNDLSNIKDTVASLQHDTESLLLHQGRLSTDLQDGLLRTRMVRFSQIVPRLQRLVRQTGSSLNKSAQFEVQGAEGEMDRAILERMVSPLEHILRNALSHGIEDSKQRKEAGKPASGKVTLSLGREATDVVIKVADDGRGLNLESIRERAIERGLLDRNAEISDRDLIQFVLEPGFSTAKEVTQIAGRGVGMDVVTNEVKQLGGSLLIDSEPGKGTQFTIRLPFTLAISHAMLIQQGDDVYAILHSGIEGVVRVSRDHLAACYAGKQEGFSYAGRDYKVRYLGQLLGVAEPDLSKGKKWLPMLLVRAGDQRMALQVDGFIGNRQIVVKSVGVQLGTVRWISGGTVLGDGRVALILDVNALARMSAAHPVAPAVEPAADRAPEITVMVVDDSITVRKVTSRLLARHNMGIMLAKDGVDAVAQLQDQIPDVMLLDIEMPRMDGYELARHMRSSARLKHVPVIMITSRVGEKHRKRAMDLGVKRYLGKPYQETELMDNIFAVLAEANA